MAEKPRTAKPSEESVSKTPSSADETVGTPASLGPPSGAAPATFDFLAPDDRGALGRLGPYRVLKVLGQGGMGIVFLAEDPTLHRHVALKVMLPAVAQKTIARERFLREARTTAQIEHDHIVAIYQIGEDRGVPFLAMPLLKGMSLDDFLRHGNRPTLRQALRIARETAQGLAAAHARGLIHRDIKPANLWLEDRALEPAAKFEPGTSADTPPAAGARLLTAVRVKILDFGLARPANDDANMTQEGQILGTPSYMSPEQARGKNVDGRSDLFSLGCLLYRLTTGTLPFPGTETMAVLYALATEAPRPVGALNPDVPPPVADLIHRLLEKDAAKRPQTAKAVVEAIQAIERELAGRTPAAPTGAMPVPSGASATMPGIDVELVKRPSVAAKAVVAVAPPQKPGRRLLLIGLGLGLGAVLLTCALCCVFSLLPDHGDVVLSAGDDRAEGLLGKTGLHAIESRNGAVHELTFGSQTLRAGKYTVDPASVPAGVLLDALEFEVRRSSPATLVVHSVPVAQPPALARAPFDDVQARSHQQQWAAFLKRDSLEANSIGMTLVLIPPGEFDMGAPDDEYKKHAQKLGKMFPDLLMRRPAGEGPVHKVRITRPFLIGATEVTVGQFRTFVKETKYATVAEKDGKGGTAVVDVSKIEKVDKGKGVLGLVEKELRKPIYTWEAPGFKLSDQHPLCNVTRQDADSFCRWLTVKEKKRYRLPTEAEWEYACRAGTTTAWFSADQILLKDSPAMWTLINSKSTAHPVRSWASNAFGIVDMHGNVAEMCADYFDPDYYAMPPPVDNPGGPPDRGKGHAVRGGDFHRLPLFARSAARSSDSNAPSVLIGFRVVCEIPH